MNIVIDQKKIEEDNTKTIQSMQIKQSLRDGGHAGKPKKQGTFAVEDFDAVGSITVNGATSAAVELELESLEEKPWRKPGADITDYFNYGFTEDTWQAYCSRQRRMRVNESGAGLPAGPGGSSHHYNRTTQLNTSGISNGKMSANSHSSVPSTIPTLGSSAPPIRLTGTGVPGLTLNTSESTDLETEKKQEPAPISVMTSD